MAYSVRLWFETQRFESWLVRIFVIVIVHMDWSAQCCLPVGLVMTTYHWNCSNCRKSKQIGTYVVFDV